MITYARQSAARMFSMNRTEVRIWNVLHEGPLEAAEIAKRLHGVDYFEIMDAIYNMARNGDIKPITED